MNKHGVTSNEVELPWQLLPGLVVVSEANGCPRHISPAYANLTRLSGLDAADATRYTWLDAFDTASRQALLAALREPEDFCVPLRLAPGVGPARWFEVRSHWAAASRVHVCLFHDVTAGKQAELAALGQAQILRLTADAVPALIAYYEAEGKRCVFANRQYAHTFGWDEVSILGRTLAEVIGAAAARQIEPHVEQMLSEQRAVVYERELTRADGQRQWIEVNLLPHVDTEGRSVAAFVLIVDITRHRLAERAVRESEERLAKFMQASAEGMVFHRNGIITDVNPPLCALTGYTHEQLVGRHVLDFVAPDEVPRVSTVMEQAAEVTYESEIVDRHGHRIPVEFIARTMTRNGERLRMTIVRDLRDRLAAQARIHHLAHHDALTGLANRTAFVDQLDHRILDAAASGEQLALLFIDLDDFKRVNDSLGHLAGDKLLRTVAMRLTDTLGSTERTARFGGDEFLVLLPQVRDRGAIEALARELLAAIEVPVEADGRLISVTPSIGIAVYPEHAQTPAELIQHANTAMYLAKSRGRANYQFFDPALAQSAYTALVMESRLVQAIERDEFVLHFQPQVRCSDQAVVGAEALIRWNHPERGLLLPDAFIPFAEQQRLMWPLGQWVLREAVRSAKRWQAAGLGATPIAVNLSTVQFQAMGFVEAVERVLHEEGVPGAWLELELSERMLMDDLPEVRAKLQRLKALGICISVDDFGTGYFSLRHLKELPIDKVKIDRSFVQDLPHAPDAAAIARALIQMALSLGQDVIAEGVEHPAQRDFLAAHGCEQLQGELISPPLAAAEFQTWLVQQRA
ncbi:putative bifunctional diguanylate cyclase/phosphodiesterase [Caldimonas brevitalea]|uniref:Diguanylate phosphodiesterase n=1 Tax=Caldimonas brevitalea TaxID=413882 RepID=A0A0G3BSB5_9BURK|nr:GGDEF and EAL domain-containing protein [Caldimonas brevitalea]AKJ30271.1 diguanylate phosphodiesterase [Caldimonas brevitalea]